MVPLSGPKAGFRKTDFRFSASSSNTKSPWEDGHAVPITAAAVMLNLTSGVDVKVLSTQGTEASYRELVPQFEKMSGHRVTTVFTGTLDANRRLATGEAYDLIIMPRPAIDEHVKGGKVVAGSRADIAKSGIGVGVKAGAAKPEIGSAAALKQALLAARSIGYSTGPSGNYLVSLFQKMGIADAIKDKVTQTPTGVFVGSIIASGEVEIGFQQVSELSHFAGVDYVGPLPPEVQFITVFSGAVTAEAKRADAAQALLRFLTAPEAAPAYRKRGMEPG